MKRRSTPILLLLAACAGSTHLTDVYRDPTANRLQFQRVAAIAIAKDPQLRRAAEDAMIQHMNGKGVASYTLLAAEDERNADSAFAKLRSLNIDGAVTMELLSSGEEPIDVQGNVPDSYKAFAGYYGTGHGAPGWEQVARVETQIFSVNEKKLLWSAASKTFNPGSAKQIVDEVATAVASELRKDNLIP